MDLDFLVCILLECERTKIKILYFYKGTKWLPFKKGPKLCASDFGDVQKNMIYLVWRSPAFEGPIFMLEQERWQRWLKKSKVNLANIVTLWECPCRAPAYAHDGPLLMREQTRWKNEGKWQFSRHYYSVWCAILVAQPQLMPMMAQSA